MNFRIRLGIAVTGITVAALALTGCSLPGTIPLGSPPVLIADETQGKAERSASMRGTRLCVINNSTSPMSIFWRGYPDAREIPVGERNCNSGYETVRDRPDVEALISYVVPGEAGKLRTLEVSAHNFWQFPPGAAAMVIDSAGVRRGVCHDFSVGESKFVDTGWLRGVMTRLDDSADNKEFEFELTDKIGEPGGGDCAPRK
jgi:hypothetical protein